MNDPIDEPVKQAAEDIDNEASKREKGPKRRDSGDLGEERDYTSPK